MVTCTDANVDHLRRSAPGAAGAGSSTTGSMLTSPGCSTPPTARGARPTLRRSLRVVSVGRFVPKKGFDMLVAAVGRLRERGLDVELVIAGERGDADETSRRSGCAPTVSAESVKMPGPLSQAELLALYRARDVFALACRVIDDGDRDGIPNVLVEAMAAGLPVVSTPVSGIPELVVDGENGLLVAPEDPAALADAIWPLAKDPALRDAARRRPAGGPSPSGSTVTGWPGDWRRCSRGGR